MTTDPSRDLLLFAPLKTQSSKARLKDVLDQLSADQMLILLKTLEAMDTTEPDVQRLAKKVAKKLMGGQHK